MREAVLGAYYGESDLNEEILNRRFTVTIPLGDLVEVCLKGQKLELQLTNAEMEALLEQIERMALSGTCDDLTRTLQLRTKRSTARMDS